MQGLANHIVPKPCAVGRETGGEASVGVYIGRLIEPRKSNSPERRRRRACSEGNMDARGIASAHPALRGRRGWHVYTFLVREPGELRIGHQVADGPYREDDEL
jgi:hypothetical protein